MNDLALLQQVIDRWISMGQALVASIGALAFVLALACIAKTWWYVGERPAQAVSPRRAPCGGPRRPSPDTWASTTWRYPSRKRT